MTRLLIGADLGSSAMKAVLVDPERGPLATAEHPYPMHHPRPGWAENDPEDWVRALGVVCRRLVANAGVPAHDVEALAVVAQRDPFVLLDASGHVLAPAIHWSDTRDPDEVSDLFDRIGRERLADTCGTVAVPGLGLPNLAWTRRHQPAVWARVRHILGPKDFILFRLTGDIATDDTSPSRSLLTDWRSGDWSDDLLEAAGLERSLFAPVRHRPWEAIAQLSGDAASNLGLAPGTVLVAGGSDDQAATLGSGVTRPGTVSVSGASSTAWRFAVPDPVPDPRRLMDLVRHVVPDMFTFEITAVGAGTSLRWYREVFGGDAPYEALLADAATVSPGADGLTFFPFLSGSSVPRPDPDASGVFFGLRAGHGRAHVVRAIVEGTAYLYPDFIDIIEGFGTPVTSLTMVDGEARSPLWNQVKADVTARQVRTLRTSEGASVGAAILAGMGCGVFSSAEAGVAALVEIDRVFTPESVSVTRYAELRQTWCAIRDHLFGAFHARAGAGPA